MDEIIRLLTAEREQADHQHQFALTAGIIPESDRRMFLVEFRETSSR